LAETPREENDARDVEKADEEPTTKSAIGSA